MNTGNGRYAAAHSVRNYQRPPPPSHISIIAPQTGNRGRSHGQLPPPPQFEADNGGNSPDSLETTQSPSAQRWGRSNFSEDEINALETPLPPPTPTTPLDNPHGSVKRNPTRERINDNSLSTPQKLLHGALTILPAMCFAAAAHFINDIKSDFKLTTAAFSVFQGVFWPSFVFLGIEIFTRSKSNDTSDDEENVPSRFAALCCTGGRWKMALLLISHSSLSSISIMAQMFSIQRLNISVSLALSFSSVIFVILLAYINRERKCSLELLVFSILGYLGFIVVGLPAMLSPSQRISEDLTAGLAASLVVMGTAIPGAFILRKLRQERSPDSLIATSFAIHGSLFSFLIRLAMTTTFTNNVDILDPLSFGWIAGLLSLVIVGTILLFLEAKFTRVYRRSENPQERRQFGPIVNVSRVRVLIFVFSCLWEIIRQGIWNTFPDSYDIFGSILIFGAFLLSVGYEAWSLWLSEEEKQSAVPFQFIPWLFSRSKRSNSK